MNQLINDVSTGVDLDENKKYSKFGTFEIFTLNDLVINHSDQPGVTEPTINSSAIQGYSKVVGQVDGFNTRIEQNEADIILQANATSGNTTQININANAITSLATDVSGNTSSIVQNSTSITSLVSDVAGNSSSITQNSNSITSLVTDTNSNTSAIQQNATEINLRVTTADFNSQISVTEGKIAMKVGDSASVKAQVVVDAVNGGTVNIGGERINITGNATFNSLQSQANSTDSNLTNLQTALGDLAYEDLVEEAKLGTTIINGGYIKTTLLDVDDIFAQNITATGTITGGTFSGGEYKTIGGASNETVKLKDGIVEFLYNGSSTGFLKPGGILGVTGIACDGDFGVTGEITRSLYMGILSSADIILQDSGNRIKGQDGGSGQIYFSSGKWIITGTTVFNNIVTVDTQLAISGTSTPSINFDGVILEKNGGDLYWDGVKIN